MKTYSLLMYVNITHYTKINNKKKKGKLQKKLQSYYFFLNKKG